MRGKELSINSKTAKPKIHEEAKNNKDKTISSLEYYTIIPEGEMIYLSIFSFFILTSGAGYLIASILPIAVSRAERLSISPALGFVAFGEIVFAVATFLNLNVLSIIVSLFLLITISCLLFFKFREKENVEILGVLKTWPFWVIFLTLGIYIYWVFLNKILSPDLLGNLTIGPPALYGDTALHAGYISRIVFGGFPIENPFFAGIPLVYPFFNNLLSAVMVDLGSNLKYALILPQFFFFFGFLILYFKFLKGFCKSWGSFAAAATFFLGWGIGFIYFFRESTSGVGFFNFVQMVGDFTHNDKYHLNLHNVITSMILPERTFLPGLFLGMLLTNIFLKKDLAKKSMIFGAIILGILPLWHTHTFLFFSISSAFWFLFWIHGSFKNKFKCAAMFFGIAVILSFPVFLRSASQVSASHFVNFISGWMVGSENMFVYWFKNSIILIPFSIAGFIFLGKEKRYFFLAPFAIFILANFISFQPWDWDNIKLLAWAILFWSALVGVFYDILLAKNIIFVPMLAVVLTLSSLSGLLSLGTQFHANYVLYTKAGVDLAQWVKRNTSSDAVFIGETIHNHPVPELSGRSLYMGYPGYLWVHGIDYSEREKLNNEVLDGDLNLARSLSPKVSYVVIGPNHTAQEKFSEKPVFENSEYKVFKIK